MTRMTRRQATALAAELRAQGRVVEVYKVHGRCMVSGRVVFYTRWEVM